ncbi:MAG: hypothetical protein HGA38_05065 [Candidatus Moranbacteria bacterium]|nr:hypothetical protein [Candidatus Moranbacteria bacterium]
MERMNRLPDYSFFRGDNLTDSEKERVAAAVRDYALDLPVERQALAPERLSEVAESISDISEWITNRLGLDPSERVPDESRVSFFSDDEWYKVTESIGVPSDNVAVQNSANGVILMKECADENERRAILSHELIHGFSRKVVKVARERTGEKRPAGITLYGFRNATDDSFNWLNEVMTDSINIEVLSASRRTGTSEILDNLPDNPYRRGIILFDMVFERIADITGRDMRAVRNDFYAAYFDGDVSPLRVIRQVFGSRALKQLAEMKEFRIRPIDLRP